MRKIIIMLTVLFGLISNIAKADMYYHGTLAAMSGHHYAVLDGTQVIWKELNGDVIIRYSSYASFSGTNWTNDGAPYVEVRFAAGVTYEAGSTTLSVAQQIDPTVSEEASDIQTLDVWSVALSNGALPHPDGTGSNKIFELSWTGLASDWNPNIRDVINTVRAKSSTTLSSIQSAIALLEGLRDGEYQATNLQPWIDVWKAKELPFLTSAFDWTPYPLGATYYLKFYLSEYANPSDLSSALNGIKNMPETTNAEIAAKVAAHNAINVLGNGYQNYIKTFSQKGFYIETVEGVSLNLEYNTNDYADNSAVASAIATITAMSVTSTTEREAKAVAIEALNLSGQDDWATSVRNSLITGSFDVTVAGVSHTINWNSNGYNSLNDAKIGFNTINNLPHSTESQRDTKVNSFVNNTSLSGGSYVQYLRAMVYYSDVTYTKEINSVDYTLEYNTENYADNAAVDLVLDPVVALAEDTVGNITIKIEALRALVNISGLEVYVASLGELSNSFDDTQLKSDIADNTSDISDNASDISDNASDISDNASDISANASDISTNESNISTNSSDIATNVVDIATNILGIAANKVLAESNKLKADTNASDITVLNAGQLVNDNKITAIEAKNLLQDGSISALEAEQLVQDGLISAVEAKALVNETAISTNVTNITANATNIFNLETDVSTLSSNVQSNLNDIISLGSIQVVDDNLNTILSSVDASGESLVTKGYVDAKVLENANDIVNNFNATVTNATNISTNGTDIGNLETVVSDLDAAYKSADTAIIALINGLDLSGSGVLQADLTAQLNALKSDITSAYVLVTDGLEARIVALETQVETNKNDIADNVSDIADNTSDISDNTTAIDTNAADIASNLSNLTSLSGQVNTLDTSVGNLQTDVGNNTSSISDLEGVSEWTAYTLYNRGDIVSYNGTLYQLHIGSAYSSAIDLRYWNEVTELSVAQNASDISSNDAYITNNTTNITANTDAINNIDTSGIEVNSNSISSLEGASEWVPYDSVSGEGVYYQGALVTNGGKLYRLDTTVMHGSTFKDYQWTLITDESVSVSQNTSDISQNSSDIANIVNVASEWKGVSVIQPDFIDGSTASDDFEDTLQYKADGTLQTANTTLGEVSNGTESHSSNYSLTTKAYVDGVISTIDVEGTIENSLGNVQVLYGTHNGCTDPSGCLGSSDGNSGTYDLNDQSVDSANDSGKKLVTKDGIDIIVDKKIVNKANISYVDSQNVAQDALIAANEALAQANEVLAAANAIKAEANKVLAEANASKIVNIEAKNVDQDNKIDTNKTNIESNKVEIDTNTVTTNYVNSYKSTLFQDYNDGILGGNSEGCKDCRTDIDNNSKEIKALNGKIDDHAAINFASTQASNFAGSEGLGLGFAHSGNSYALSATTKKNIGDNFKVTGSISTSTNGTSSQGIGLNWSWK